MNAREWKPRLIVCARSELPARFGKRGFGANWPNTELAATLRSSSSSRAHSTWPFCTRLAASLATVSSSGSGAAGCLARGVFDRGDAGGLRRGQVSALPAVSGGSTRTRRAANSTSCWMPREQREHWASRSARGELMMHTDGTILRDCCCAAVCRCGLRIHRAVLSELVAGLMKSEFRLPGGCAIVYELRLLRRRAARTSLP